MRQRFVYVAVEEVLPEPDGIFTSKVDQKTALEAFFCGCYCLALVLAEV